MENSEQTIDKVLLSRYYQWLLVKGRSKATARAYFLEVLRCRDSLSECKLSLTDVGICFAQLAEAYVNDTSLSLATRRRRYHSISLFSKFSGFSLSIERPRSFKVPLAEHSSVELPGNPSSKLLKHSSGEVWHHSSGELLNPGNGKSDDGLKSDDLPLELSLALTKKQKRRWKLTGLRNRAMTLLAVVCRLKTSQLADLIISSIVIDGNKAVLSTELTSLVIPNLIRTAVLEYLMARHERQFGSEYLFVNSRGGPLSVRTVQYGIKRYLKDCGNPDGISSTSKARKKYDELMSVKLTAGLLRKLVGI